jgi:putative DNA methylase
MTDDRCLIEDFLPIEAISEEASREKFVRYGHISSLHLWWARRPMVACRAAVYGALVPASQFVPTGGTNTQKKSLGRANAAKFVKSLCQYPGSPSVIKEAQEHLLKAHAERLTAELRNVGQASGLPVLEPPAPTLLALREGRNRQVGDLTHNYPGQLGSPNSTGLLRKPW